MMRGKLEKNDSKVKEMYMISLKHKNQDKFKSQVSFTSLNAIHSRFDELLERASREGGPRKRTNKASGLSPVGSKKS